MKTFWILAIFVVLCVPALAADSWVVAARRQGTVQSRLAGSENWSRIMVNRRLGFGDAIRTGTDSAAQIVFQDGSLVRIGPVTTLRISEAAYEVARRQTRLDLEGGSVEARVAPFQGKTNRFEVRTPNAVLAAQGTHFLVDATDVTKVVVVHGAVRMTSHATGDSVLLRAGSTGRAEADGELLVNPADFSFPQAVESLGLPEGGAEGAEGAEHGTVYDSEPEGHTGFDSHRISDGRGDDVGELGEEDGAGFVNPSAGTGEGGLLIRIPQP